MPITALPTPPLRTDPTNFAARADAFLAALAQFVTEANATAAAMNFNSTNDTSTTSNTLSISQKTFTVSAGKSFQPGMYLVIADAALPSTNSMLVQVDSYSGSTLVCTAKLINGSGTKASWYISQSSIGLGIGGTAMGNQEFIRQTLDVSTATLNWDCNLGAMAIAYMNGNKTMANPTNQKMGTYILNIKNDASARTITWGSNYVWPQSIPPDLGGANALTIISFVCDGTYMYGSYTPY